MRVKTLSLTVLAISTFFSYSYANDCASISDDEKRLTCYDNISKSDLKKTNNSTGKWTIETDLSPIDDSKRVFLNLYANERVGRNFMSSKPILFIRCENNKTELFIDWGGFVKMKRAEMTIRIDKEPAVTTSWSMSTDGQASFAPKPIALIKDMEYKDNLLVRIIPYAENPYTVNFDIKGLDNAIAPVREACGW